MIADNAVYRRCTVSHGCRYLGLVWVPDANVFEQQLIAAMGRPVKGEEWFDDPFRIRDLIAEGWLHDVRDFSVGLTIGITGPREWSHHCGTTLYAAPCSCRCYGALWDRVGRIVMYVENGTGNANAYPSGLSIIAHAARTAARNTRQVRNQSARMFHVRVVTILRHNER